MARQPTHSSSNIFHSLSAIYRSASILPASLLDFDVVSATGLQVIRPETHPEAFVPLPPDGGWGWVVVFAAFITNLVIDGICVSFGIMAGDFMEHFQSPMSTVMLIGSLLLGVCFMVGPITASLVNRFGCRAVGIGGGLLATASMFASAFMPTIELMLALYGILAGAAFGLLHLPSIICVSFYFDSRRALAIGITSCGGPLGAMVFAPLTEALLTKYGWSNTLILFAGMLLNCAALATLYRPLMPALLLTPMKPTDADITKSLLQFAATQTDGQNVTGASPLISQRELRDLPLIEEPEGTTDIQPPQLAPISETPERELNTHEQIASGDHRKESKGRNQEADRRHHHIHHGQRKADQMVSSCQPNGNIKHHMAGLDVDVVDESSASTCESSCNEEASHWSSPVEENEKTVPDESKRVEERDVLGPLSQPKSQRVPPASARRDVPQGSRNRRLPTRAASTSECALSTPNLGGPSRGPLQLPKRPHECSSRNISAECHSSRVYSKPLPRQSVWQIARASVPRNQAESISVTGLGRSHISAPGSQVFASIASGIADGGGGGGANSLEEMAETGVPVVVELPHESISVEDYARPLYRKDIFFPGSVKRQIESSAALLAAVSSTLVTSNEQIGGSKLSVTMPDGTRRRKIPGQFGSNILFGDNVPLPPINEPVDLEEDTACEINWTGSCIMSLTKIPLPDVFETHEVRDDFVDEFASQFDRLKMETGLNLADVPADGIYRVPRSATLCGWWLCWKTLQTSNPNLSDKPAVEQLNTFLESNDRGRSTKFSQNTRMVLIRKCQFMPKSICDVLATMTNLSLFKSMAFKLFCLANLIALMGLYVPLFFICDLADSFNIPKSQSAYLLTVYGGACVVSRLASSFAAGSPKVSPLLTCTITLLISGVIVCILPYWGSLMGQAILMTAFGLMVSPFLALTSIILCDILDLEALTNAYGIVTLVRGIGSTIGSPGASIIVSKTGTLSAALVISGATIVIGGIFYMAIFLCEKAKLNKLLQDEMDRDQNKM